MGLMNPEVGEPLDKMTDVYPEGEPFFLEGIRIVEANTQDYGKGEMVVVRVRGHERELGVWGVYLLAQAKSVQPSDLHKWYKIERRRVEGFGKVQNGQRRPVKAFTPAEPPSQGAGEQVQASMGETVQQVPGGAPTA